MIKRNKSILNSLIATACISFMIPVTLTYADLNNISVDSFTNTTLYAQSEYANFTDNNNITWEYSKLTDNTAEVKCLNTNGKTSIEIPSKVNGLTVTKLSDEAFLYVDDITSIKIPSTVTTIGDYAFNGMESLSSIDIPSSVTTIGFHAFDYTKWIENQSESASNHMVIINNILIDGKSTTGDITIPSNVKSIAAEAFSHGISKRKAPRLQYDYDYYSKIKSVVIPENVNLIGSEAFSCCDNLESVTIKGNPILEDYAFSSCKNLKNVNIPSSLDVRNAFIGTPYIDNLENSSDDFIISGGTLIKINNLHGEVKIPSNVKIIGSNVFTRNDNVTSVIIPSSVKKISVGAFDSSQIKEVTFEGDGLECIESGAFVACDNLTSIKIPKTVTSIGQAIFSKCKSLKNVDLTSKITTIPDCVFLDCESLKDITIPKGVTEIGPRAFCNCANLTSVKIPNTVVNIDGEAFDQCPKLKTVYAEGEYAKNYFTGKNIDIKSYTSEENNLITNDSTNISNSIGVTTYAKSSDKGWVLINNNWYYKDANGNNYTGWMNINNKIYYFYGDGTMAVSFVKLGEDSIFYFDPVSGGNMGVSVIGWKKIDGYWYYFSPNPDSLGHKGMMQKGWIYDGGNWYYLYSDGKMASNTWIDNYYVNRSGAWTATR